MEHVPQRANDEGSDMNTLDHLAELMAKATSFPEDLQPEEEGSYRCPVCDGEGTVDGEWVTHVRSHNWVGGVQFYGIGEEHKLAEEFYLAARTHFPALLEIARAAAGYKASVEALQDAMADIGEDGDLWTFEDRHAAARDALAAALAKLNPKETT